MRHPMYVAESCFWVGIVVLFGSPVAAAASTCLAALAVTRLIPKEEKALEEQFGEEYRSYRNRVPRLPGFGDRKV